MKREVLGFIIVGGICFFIDTGLLQFFTFLGIGPYLGRLVSFSTALLASWWLNRTYSFKTQDRASAREVVKYAVLVTLGGAINWGVYSICLELWLKDNAYPALAIIPATCISMIFNFMVMKLFIFRQKVS